MAQSDFKRGHSVSLLKVLVFQAGLPEVKKFLGIA